LLKAIRTILTLPVKHPTTAGNQEQLAESVLNEMPDYWCVNS